MALDYSTFKTEVVTALALEVSGEPTYSENVVKSKVESVIRELIQMRRYNKTSMTDTQIQADLENYFPQVLNVSRYDFNQIGSEGEDRHSENGIDRTYTQRHKLWNGVVPIGRVIDK